MIERRKRERADVGRLVIALVGLLIALCATVMSGQVQQQNLFAQSVTEHLNQNFRRPDLSWVMLDASGSVIAQRWKEPQVPVAPGSLVKPFVALAYAEQHSGRFPLVHCTGTAGHCWYPKGHGTLGIEKAIAESCNAYFLALGKDLDRKQAAPTYARYGLKGPPFNAANESLIGLGEAWKELPMALAEAYLRLANDGLQSRGQRVLTGMQASASNGTARGVDAALGVNGALAKTGTAECAHRPRGAGDGFAVVLYPAGQPRILLLLRMHGARGARTAEMAGRMLRSIGVGGAIGPTLSDAKLR